MRRAKKIKLTLRSLKRKAPKVPDLTCPIIDDVIGKIDQNLNNKFCTLKKNEVRYIKKRMEEIRSANDKLRDSGRYWYDKTREIIEPDSMIDYEGN